MKRSLSIVLISLVAATNARGPAACFVPASTASGVDRSQTAAPWVNARSHSASHSPVPISTSTSLFGKKKAAGGGATKKIQVRMLKYIAGTGSVGDVIMVTPAFFNNKLRPTKSAEEISDDQVKEEQAEHAADEKATREKATALKEKLTDVTLQIKRKCGPEGQLFGGIGAKQIMEELRSQEKDEFLATKGIKVQAVTDADDKKMRGDIKHTGTFGATIGLSKDISVKVTLEVTSM